MAPRYDTEVFHIFRLNLLELLLSWKCKPLLRKAHTYRSGQYVPGIIITMEPLHSLSALRNAFLLFLIKVTQTSLAHGAPDIRIFNPHPDQASLCNRLPASRKTRDNMYICLVHSCLNHRQIKTSPGSRAGKDHCKAKETLAPHVSGFLEQLGG